MLTEVPSQPSRHKHLADGTSIRGDDRARIIQELNSDGKTNRFGVSIVGIGGAGKTVLARDVARNTSLDDHFHVIDPPPSADFNLEEVLEFVCTKPKDAQPNKKFLILLDGLHSVEPPAWHRFRSHCQRVLLPAEIKFLITTQNPKVADTTGTSKHCLNPLPDDDCFSLITELANANENLSEKDNRAITHYKKQLVDLCKGLPLLANQIGLLLSAAPKDNRGSTIQDLKSSRMVPALQEALVDLKPVFLLAEKPQLIRCLAYCSLFPQDYEFQKDNLVRLWIAERFILDERNTRQLERTARGYFDELLVCCSLFQPSAVPPGDEPSYKMHRLAYVMAQTVASNIFRREGVGMSNSTSEISSTTYHFSLIGEHDDIKKLLHDIRIACPSLRTFLLFNNAGKKIEKNPTFFKTLKCLRVLDLSHTNLTKLDSRHISKLKYLGYLDLSHTPVKTLPDLSNSPQLQVLKLNYCANLRDLPKDVTKLISLVSLEVNTSGLVSLPLGIGKLTNLQRLDVFAVGMKEGFKIAELKNLNHLKKPLRITQLENVETEKDAQEANLSGKGMLLRLELEWSSSATDKMEAAKQVFEGLQPPKDLKELVIRNYPSAGFPEWLSNPDVCRMLESVHLHNCKAIPSLGPLEGLKTLRVDAMHKDFDKNVLLDEEQRGWVTLRGIKVVIDSEQLNMSDLSNPDTSGDPGSSVQATTNGSQPASPGGINLQITNMNDNLGGTTNGDQQTSPAATGQNAPMHDNSQDHGTADGDQQTSPTATDQIANMHDNFEGTTIGVLQTSLTTTNEIANLNDNFQCVKTLSNQPNKDQGTTDRYQQHSPTAIDKIAHMNDNLQGTTNGVQQTSPAATNQIAPVHDNSQDHGTTDGDQETSPTATNQIANMHDNLKGTTIGVLQTSLTTTNEIAKLNDNVQGTTIGVLQTSLTTTNEIANLNDNVQGKTAGDLQTSLTATVIANCNDNVQDQGTTYEDEQISPTTADQVAGKNDNLQETTNEFQQTWPTAADRIAA